MGKPSDLDIRSCTQLMLTRSKSASTLALTLTCNKHHMTKVTAPALSASSYAAQHASIIGMSRVNTKIALVFAGKFSARERPCKFMRNKV